MGPLRFSHTHLSPGAHGSAAGELTIGEDCRLEFSDGVEVPARIDRIGGNLVLSVATHSTARGTEIAAKRWKLLAEPGEGETRLRIAGRLSDPA